MYKDKQGVLTFTNVPNHTGYKRILKEGPRPVAVAAMRPAQRLTT